MSTPTIGLTLGGGGVRGLAHIPVLELFDEMEIRPVVIAGCSMGALLGALYASGKSGQEIRALVEKHTVLGDDGLRDVIRKGSSLLKWVTGFVPEIHRGGLINADGFFSYLLGPLEEMSFDELSIPLVVVATDFWSGECVTFRDGPMSPAVRASMAVPGVFAAVEVDGKVLVDGGLVNHLPYEEIADDCDVVVAVDVAGERRPGKRETPGTFDAILGAMDIMQTVALKRRLESRRPEILVHSRIRDVEMLEVTKIDSVLEQSRESIDDLRTRLQKVVGRAA